METNENDEVLRLLEKLNRAHGGTVIAHSKALYAVRNDLKAINRRLYRIEQKLGQSVRRTT